MAIQLISGVSTGLGRALAEAALARVKLSSAQFETVKTASIGGIVTFPGLGIYSRQQVCFGGIVRGTRGGSARSENLRHGNRTGLVPH